MQDWMRQRNTARRTPRRSIWSRVARHRAGVPGARFRERRKALARLTASFAALGLFAAQPEALAQASPAAGTGMLVARTAAGEVPLPQLDAHFDIVVAGPIARTTLRQRFRNPGSDFIEATYRFPLPDDAAVDHLTVEAGGQRIVGEIREREVARRSYEQARDGGQRAALVSSERANLFTTALANIGPGEVVTVEIEYQQRVRRDGSRYRLRVPTAVTPRYDAAPAPGGQSLASMPAAVTHAVAATDLVHDSHTLSLDIDLDVGLPLADIVSRHHRIDVSPGTGTRQRVSLSGASRLDADFVLEWQPRDASETQVAAFGHSTGDTGYAFVQLVPPLAVDVSLAPPRELILVLDTSGSMEGASIVEAVAAVTRAIEQLRLVDRFNVIAFDDDVQRLFPASRAATPAHRAQALAWLKRQRADGGTEMRPALHAALCAPPADGFLRQVIFATDGAVGNEASLFEDINNWLGTSRLFTVGIGAAPNGWFMRKAAETGRGTFVLVGNAADVNEAMSGLFVRMAQPVLTDVSVDWDGRGAEAYPAHIADLYAGEPVEVSARFDGPVPSRLMVSGTQWLGGVAVPWQHEVPIDTSVGSHRPGVAVTWARDKLEALDDARRVGLPEAVARAAMLEVALTHHIVSEVTSLVAVDATPVRAAGPVSRTDVPGLLPRGMAPMSQLTATGTRAPLQRLVGGIAVLLALWIALLQRVFLPATREHLEPA